MALKYYFEYTVKSVKPDNTIDEVLNRCEIFNDDFVGDATEIKGNVTVVKVNDDDVLKPTRGGGLKLQLEANTDLTFEDFQTEKERQYYVKYFRNGQLISISWLDPEGLFEDYVNNEWILSLDCTDGIGFLNNLEYVDNTTKERFIGKQSMLEVIVNCLKRTNIDMNIYTSLNVYYDVQSTLTDTFSQAYINANRFIKDDNNTVMNCAEVLSSILELFGAVITQYKGEWYIYKPNELTDNTSLTFYGYDSDGVALNPTTYTIDFAQTIGSRGDGFYPHHINANQQFSRVSPIGAYRINYKYGIVKSFFENIPLISVLTPPAINETVDEWTINDYTNLTFPSSNEGFILAKVSSVSSPTLLATSDSFNFQTGDFLNFNISLRNNEATPINRENTDAKFKLILDDSGTLYYMDIDGGWSTTDTFISLRAWNAVSNFIIKSQSIPQTGSIYIEVWRPKGNQLADSPDVLLLNCNFSPVVDSEDQQTGEIFTFTNHTNESTKITETKEVFNGDAPTDVYEGTIYQSDQTTPTDLWYRNEAVLNFRPILQIMGEEKMTINSKFARVYRGDVFGYVDFLSVITINNFDNVFMPIEYYYNSADNITRLKLREIIDSNYTDIETVSSFDNGEVTKPTIKN